jgi:predicted secreted protein
MALDVRVAAPFDVPLGSAPGAGYTWQLDAVPDGIELLGSDFSSRADAPVGDPATQVFHLRAGRAGQFVLNFVLKRRWEAAAVETREVEINAR